MPSSITLEQVEKLAAQLPANEQLRLISHLSAELSGEATNGQNQEEYFARMDEFIRLCDEMAVDSKEDLDSAEDIRQIREERISQL